MPNHHADLNDTPNEAFCFRERVSRQPQGGSTGVICAPAGWTKKRVLSGWPGNRVLGTPKPCRFCTGKFSRHKREHWVISNRRHICRWFCK
jgi:hypothetical protein